MRQIQVELVEHSPDAPFSGIGRYTRMLREHLLGRVELRMARQIDPPLTRYAPFFEHLPVGVGGHRRGSLVHFVEDLGCSQMLWRPVHPAIATSHDLGMLVWPSEARMHRPLDRFVWYLSYMGLTRMDAIITVSEFSRQMVIKRLRVPSERVFAVHSGVDTSLFRPMDGAREEAISRYRLPTGEGIKYLLYVGTEIPRKNMWTVLKVLSGLPANVRLLKVGAAGGWRFRGRTDKAIRELDLEDRVTLLEEVSEADLALLYNAADVYIAPSYLEGFCLPVLEAMACGTPVVCSNVASLPEVAGEAAIMLHPSDAAGFTRAIMSVLDDHALRERMRSSGLERAAKFSWRRTAEGVTAVYESVLEQCGGRHEPTGPGLRR